MRKVLLITNQTTLPGERGFMRNLSLYAMLEQTGHKVHLVTSKFNHYDKQHRDVILFHKNYPNFKISFIEEPGYKKNVSFKRIFSQWCFAKNLYKWFTDNVSNYDVVFMTVPTYEGAALVGRYCNKHHIPYIINVEDLWPEAMRMCIKSKILFNMLTWPLAFLADVVYKQADALIAVSQQYLNRAKSVNKKASQEAVIYLGADLEKFDQGVKMYAKEIQKPVQEFWICYIGTLGESYDIKTFIEAVNSLHKQGYTLIKAKILGRGPREKYFKTYAKHLGAEIDFVGFLPYEQMAAYLFHADVMINAIKKDSQSSIINKVSEYFASGKPTLNGSIHPEMRHLISEYNTGLNYIPENAEDLAQKILILYSDKKLCQKLGQNGRKLAQEFFDRKTSYKKIIEIIDSAQVQKYEK